MGKLFAPILAAILMSGAAHAAPVTVHPAEASVIKKAIAARKGHVVVVNFWATWCGPCVAEFPDLVHFGEQYKSQGVVVMTVSADHKQDIPTKVRPFLVGHKADFPAFLEQASDPEQFIDAFDPNWQGELPRTLIYDKNGTLVKSLSGQQTAQAFAAAVRPLLSQHFTPARTADRH